MRELSLSLPETGEALKKILMFQNLTEEDIEALSALCEAYEYADAEYIVTQGSVSRYLYIILDGRCDISVKGAERRDVFLAHLDAGDVFGEASIFLEVQRTANVVADGPAKAIAVSRSNLIDFINKRPKAGLKIFSFIIYGLLHKLATANKDLAFERESNVSEDELRSLAALFPKMIDEIIT